MKVKCEKTDKCNRFECDHYGIHNHNEECDDDVCQEFDTCTEPGDLIKCVCIPVNKKRI